MRCNQRGHVIFIGQLGQRYRKFPTVASMFIQCLFYDDVKDDDEKEYEENDEKDGDYKYNKYDNEEESSWE